MAGSTSRQTLTINGSNFVNGATLTFDPPTGSNITSLASWLSFNSSTRITYQINNDNDPGTWQVRVTNPDGKTSGWSSFTVTAPATPSPSITSVSPNPVTGSNSAQSFTINGSNFQSGPNVILRDKRTGETFSNRTISSFATNRIVVNPTFTTMAATWSVEVVSPDGKSTGQFNFTVNAPATPTPSISSVSPFSVPASSSDQALTISGSNFVSGATLTFDPPTGSDIASSASKLTFVSSSQIRYQINNDNDAGTWRVRVTNPDGKLSGWANFTVAAPTGPGGFTLSHDPPYWDERSPAGPAVMLRWTHSSGATSYDIYRNGALVKASLNALKFTNDLGLVAGQSYTYHVVAKNSDGNRQSNVLSIGPMSGVPVTAPRPDLIVVPGSITFPQSSLTSGQQFALSFSIKNNGPGPAPKTTARLRLSMDNQLTSRDAPLSPLDVEIPALASGQAYGFNGPIQVPSSTLQGQYFVGVFTDAADEANQSNTTNDSGLSSSRLTVVGSGLPAPEITSHPKSVPANVGDTVTFSVSATGQNLSYQWMRFNSPIENSDGLTSPALTIPNVGKVNEGEYSVRVSSGGKFADSNRAILDVTGETLPVKRTVPGVVQTLYGAFDPNLPTIIITHGWQPTGVFDLNRPPLADLRDAIKGRLDDEGTRANILLYTWPEAYTEAAGGIILNIAAVGYPFSYVDDQGKSLAHLLRPLIGSKDYSKPIHFIGHSFGTFVNANAVKYLGKWGISVNQFTIIDSPTRTRISPFLGHANLGEYFYRRLERYKVFYVDNYYASMPYRGIPGVKMGDKIISAFPSGGYEVPQTDHSSIVSAYYTRTAARDENPRLYPNRTLGFHNSIIVGPYRDRTGTEWDPPASTSFVDFVKDGFRTVKGASTQAPHSDGTSVRNVIEISGGPANSETSGEEPERSATHTHSESPVSEDARIEFDLVIPEEADVLVFDLLFSSPDSEDFVSVAFNDETIHVFTSEGGDNDVYEGLEASVTRFAGKAGILSVSLNSTNGTSSTVRLLNMKFLSSPEQSAPRSLSRPTNLRVVRSSSSGSLTRVTLSVRDNSIGETSLAFWKQEKREGRGWKPWRRAKSLRGNFSTGTIRSSFTVPRRALHRFRASVTDGRTILNSNYIRHKSR